MSWTDYSSTTADLYGFGSSANSTDVFVSTSDQYPALSSVFLLAGQPAYLVNDLSASYNALGFEDGYQPAYVPNPIAGNLSQPDPNGGEGGGGSTRPTTGFLYPRGQG